MTVLGVRMGRVEGLAMLASFVTYFSVYAWRKPFTVGTWEGAIFGMDLKTALVVSQALGYATSKFLGIAVIGQMRRAGRESALAATMAMATLPLMALPFLPTAGALAAMFVNGLALALVWGLVVSWLEGRRSSDLLAVGLSASFIIASGATKSVGALWLDAGVPELWMPLVTAATFALPLGLGVLGLKSLPDPTPEDEAERVVRVPMDARARRMFLRTHALGLAPLIALYVALTCVRDFRDNFAADLYRAMDVQDASGWMTWGEIPIAMFSLLAMGSIVAIRDNMRAVLAIHLWVGFGAAVAALASLGWLYGAWGGVPLMVGVGLGTYLGYVPFGCALFDRLVAATGQPANAGFLVYVCDSAGYLGSVVLLIGRSFHATGAPTPEAFATGAAIAAIAVGLLAIASAFRWARAPLAA